MNPPELPDRTSSRQDNIPAAVALAVAFVSAAIHKVSFTMADDLARYRASVPPWVTEGSVGFVLAFPVWEVTLAAIGLGIMGTVILLSSLGTENREIPSFCQIAALLFLLPTAYSVCRLLCRILSFSTT